MGLREFFGIRSPAAANDALSAITDASIGEIPTIRHMGPSELGRAVAEGTRPWVSTMTPAELSLARSHGVRMVGTVVTNCWLHYGRSWTEGHAEGWHTAQDRMRAEALALGAHAVVDVKMRTSGMEDTRDACMNYSLVGTAIRFEGVPPTRKPIIATVPALEFVQLIDAGIVPTGIAVGARFNWLRQNHRLYRDNWNNVEVRDLSQFWLDLRRLAHMELVNDTRRQNGSGVLAQVQFSALYDRGENEEDGTMNILGRHIVIGTVVEMLRNAAPLPGIKLVLDMRDDSPFHRADEAHHDAYAESLGGTE